MGREIASPRPGQFIAEIADVPRKACKTVQSLRSVPLSDALTTDYLVIGSGVPAGTGDPMSVGDTRSGDGIVPPLHP